MSASNSLDPKGIIIQYDFCDGCHACEMACKQELGLEPDEYGIKIMSYGPRLMKDGTWDFFNIPVPTDYCDLCAKRVESGKLPACVHHCPGKVMEYGDVEELAKKLATIKKCVLFAPGLKD